MASVDMAPRCGICSGRIGREVRHWPDARHLGRIRRLLYRLLRH